MVVHTCNSSTQESEAGGSWIWDQPVLYSKTLLGNGGEGREKVLKVEGAYIFKNKGRVELNEKLSFEQ
jgi:hypothetical protein